MINFAMMKYTYIVNGMTCSGCESKITSQLLQIPIINQVQINREKNEVTIDAESQISADTIQSVLGGNESKYKVIKEVNEKTGITQKKSTESVAEASWFETYKPILLIFLYLIMTTLGVQLVSRQWDFMAWMRHFMAGFFLVFSFFKLLNIRAFAESYAMYDVIASRFKIWGYIYPFLELIIGLLFLFNIQIKVTNWFTLMLMSISITGVISSVLNKRKIKCACLGDVFNLPMSTVTIIEDALMILMSLIMILI